MTATRAYKGLVGPGDRTAAGGTTGRVHGVTRVQADDACTPVFAEKYRVVARLGSGGMGTLFLAEQAGPEAFCRTVVLKFVHAEDSADPEYRRMLSDEAQLTARIDHPNVGKVFDVHEVDGQLFIVLERVDGVNLAELCRRLGGPVPPWIAAGLLAQACAGLQAAHDLTIEGRPMNLIHRDVSRSNLMCDTGGRVRVIDFGIARADVRRSVTRRGEVRGNAAYMAPEQRAGGRIDRRADLYSAALVLYELCLGVHPFDPVAARAELPRLSAQGVAVSEEVDEVVAACLALEPGDRPARIDALGEALRRFAADSGVAEPRDIAGFFRAQRVSLAPGPVTPIVTPTWDRRGEDVIRLPANDGMEVALGEGRRLRVYTTHVDARATGAVELALSRVPELLPAPLSVVCTGDGLSLRCERGADERVALYLDGDRPETRQERLLVTRGLEQQSLDFGNRRRPPLQRLCCTVGRQSAGGAVAVLTGLARRVVAGPEVRLLLVVAVEEPRAGVVHAECVCVTSNLEM